MPDATEQTTRRPYYFWLGQEGKLPAPIVFNDCVFFGSPNSIDLGSIASIDHPPRMIRSIDWYREQGYDVHWMTCKTTLLKPPAIVLGKFS